MLINGATKIVGLFGDPVEHTLSPSMHNAAFDYLKLNYSYLPFNVKIKELKKALQALRALGIVGVNLTIPHKIEAIKYVDELDKQYRLIGAVNTVKCCNGKLKGYNTDGLGFLQAVKNDCDFNVENKIVLVLGAGGSAKAVAVSLAMNKVKKIIIANRTYSRARNLALYIRKKLNCNSVAMPLNGKALLGLAANIDLLVNCTSVGLGKKNISVVKKDFFKKALNLKLVYDIVYSDKQTNLIIDAKRSGIKAFNGMGMLLYQGAISFEIWTGIKPPLGIMRKALQKR